MRAALLGLAGAALLLPISWRFRADSPDCPNWPSLPVGILAAITTNISYWNWYGFPGVYTVSYMCIEIVGVVLVGVVAALLLRKHSTVVSRATVAD